MRDLHKTIAHIEHILTRGLDKQRPAAPSKQKPKSSPRVWYAPKTDVVYPSEQIFKPKKDRLMTQLTVTARALKVTVPLDAAEVAALPAPDGQARSHLAITCDGKIYRAESPANRCVKPRRLSLPMAPGMCSSLCRAS
jgi:hypothetical protein